MPGLRLMAPAIMLAALALTVSAQQLAFTTRAYVTAPVTIVSADSSREYGFESVMLRNDAAKTITGIRFQIVLHTDAGEEIADERRFTINLDPHDSKRVAVGLAEIQSLRQQTRARNQRSALAILTVEGVDFSDGSEWKQSEREQGTPIDPLVKPSELRQREK